VILRESRLWNQFGGPGENFLKKGVVVMPDSRREKSLAGVVNLPQDPRSPLHSGGAERFTS
jgi:hypothetical protein